MLYSLYFLSLFFLITSKNVISISQSIKIKSYPSFSHVSSYKYNKQRLYNTFLRILVYNDYKTIKQKINNTYHGCLTNYYNICKCYYSLDENDLFIIDNVVQLVT
jgi:hypothetical protein